MHEQWVAVAESAEVTTTLDMRTELHVKADRLGVALRRELASFVDRAST